MTITKKTPTRAENVKRRNRESSLQKLQISRNKFGELQFKDHPEFKPNLTPEQILQSGSFGGTYFRDIKSGVTGEKYHDTWKEFPENWFEGLEIKKQVSSQKYDNSVNKFKVSCGTSLDMWESKGWIRACDPYGWFQWYCRFFLGRRCSDDQRQIGRGLKVMGPTGRWRRYLINRCLSSGRPLAEAAEDESISPKVRQILQVRTLSDRLKYLQPIFCSTGAIT